MYLQQYISYCGGPANLQALGWRTHAHRRASGKKSKVDYYYISPNGVRYNSRGKVATALGLERKVMYTRYVAA